MLFYKFKKLLNLLDDKSFLELGVIPWATPILCFGDINKAKIATLGINPSDKEFLDNDLNVLINDNKRFYTIESLNINSWSNFNKDHYSAVKQSYESYFKINPYDLWFKKLDYIISGSSKSYYFPSGEACHLDMIPFATFTKWSSVSQESKDLLLEKSLFVLADLLNSSNINVLILNGTSVVRYLEKVSDCKFVEKEMYEWGIEQRNNKRVKGIAFSGSVNKLGEVCLKNRIKVIGFNHNIQSSYGVSKKILNSIRKWITIEIENYEKSGVI